MNNNPFRALYKDMEVRGAAATKVGMCIVACEALANGLVSSSGYRTIIQAIDSEMLSLHKDSRESAIWVYITSYWGMLNKYGLCYETRYDEQKCHEARLAWLKEQAAHFDDLWKDAFTN